MATSDAPIQIGRVALTVNDLPAVAEYYQQVIGLERIRADGEEAVLGVGSTALLELRQDRAARFRPNGAGLFHTAFLLPDRASLGSWLRHVAQRQVPLDGASDHLVSEAVYLRDPEGNGIEVYVDRPRNEWRWSDGEVQMDTIRLDVPAVIDLGPDWSGAPAGTVIGHVHLQVGDLARADEFVTGTLGMQRTSHRSGASFYSSGSYHHHLAGNVWNSRGAGTREANSRGLAEVVLAADPEVIGAMGAAAFEDPWGTRIRIEPKG